MAKQEAPCGCCRNVTIKPFATKQASPCNGAHMPMPAQKTAVRCKIHPHSLSACGGTIEVPLLYHLHKAGFPGCDTNSELAKIQVQALHLRSMAACNVK